MSKKSTIVFAYPGSGKSEMARTYRNVADPDRMLMSSEHLMYKIIANAHLGEGRDIVAFPFSMTLHTREYEEQFEYLKRQNLRTIVAYPSPDCALEYYDRYLKRGDSAPKARAFFTNIGQVYEETNKIVCPHAEKLIIKPAQYLSDALNEYGVELLPN